MNIRSSFPVLISPAIMKSFAGVCSISSIASGSILLCRSESDHPSPTGLFLLSAGSTCLVALAAIEWVKKVKSRLLQTPMSVEGQLPSPSISSTSIQITDRSPLLPAPSRHYSDNTSLLFDMEEDIEEVVTPPTIKMKDELCLLFSTEKEISKILDSLFIKELPVARFQHLPYKLDNHPFYRPFIKWSLGYHDENRVLPEAYRGLPSSQVIDLPSTDVLITSEPSYMEVLMPIIAQTPHDTVVYIETSFGPKFRRVKVKGTRGSLGCKAA